MTWYFKSDIKDVLIIEVDPLGDGDYIKYATFKNITEISHSITDEFVRLKLSLLMDFATNVTVKIKLRIAEVIMV